MLQTLITQVGIWRVLLNVIDIIAVAFILYWVLHLIRGTRAVYMLVTLGFLVLMYWVAIRADLVTVHWMLSYLFESLLLITVVVFQSDIRRVLSRIGRSSFFAFMGKGQETESLDEIVHAVSRLAQEKLGAIVILERDASVMDHLDQGVSIDAKISQELLHSIFLYESQIHDGAVVIQNGRVVAAGCFVPHVASLLKYSELGSRHRAALSLSEETDALVIVVSEEKGSVSLVVDGQIMQGLDSFSLRSQLMAYMQTEKEKFEETQMMKGQRETKK